jgi:uncharacterized membrane protein
MMPMPGTMHAGRVAMATAGAYVVAALALGVLVPQLPHGLFGWVNPDVKEDQVTTFLSAVSAGMMAFTGIVFSLLFVMLQFSSSAYSPHLLPMLSRNRTLIHAGGVFTGTFLYTLMALRGVGVAPGGGTPALVLGIAFAWLLASVYLLLRLVRVFSALAITDVLELISDLGWKQLDQAYAPYTPHATTSTLDELTGAGGPDVETLLHHGKPRYLVGLDLARLLELAVAHDAFIQVQPAMGDCLTAGVPLIAVRAGRGRVAEKSLREAIVLDRDRTVEASPKQAVRLLVDIAIHALSVAVNDPTTAVHALDQIEGMLLRIGNADLDIGTVRDQGGIARVSYTVPSWEDYLDLALTEIRQCGAGAVQVERRLAALLAHLRENVPEERKPAIDRVAAEQRMTLHKAIADLSIRRKAERLDRQGIGHPNGEATFHSHHAPITSR